MNKPYTSINIAATADGKMDTLERKGSVISSKREKERLDQLRTASDGNLVGGHALLGDNPKLTVESRSLRAERVARRPAPNPVKIGVPPSRILKKDQSCSLQGLQGL